jgi:hypothetical protein
MLGTRKKNGHGTLIDTVAGIGGGLLGSMAIGALMEKQGKLPEPMRGPEVKDNPAEHILEKAEEISGAHVPQRARPAVGQALHFAYGTVGPTLLGLVARRVGANRSVGRALAVGAGLGVVVWAVGYLGWLPAAKLVEPVQRQGASHVASSIVAHVAYGVLAALPIALTGKLAR